MAKQTRQSQNPHTRSAPRLPPISTDTPKGIRAHAIRDTLGALEGLPDYPGGLELQSTDSLATTVSPEIGRLISGKVRAAFAKEAGTLAGQVRLAAPLAAHVWICRAPAARVACGKRTQGVR